MWSPRLVRGEGALELCGVCVAKACQRVVVCDRESQIM